MYRKAVSSLNVVVVDLDCVIVFRSISISSCKFLHSVCGTISVFQPLALSRIGFKLLHLSGLAIFLAFSENQLIGRLLRAN